jgi:phosphoglycerate dehydrogenase-like enzyme
MALKILLLRSFLPHDLNYLEIHLSEHYEFIIPTDFSDENLVNLAKDADIFIGNKIFKELINAAKNLKVIQVPGVGVDKVDLELLKNTDISLCNSHSNAQYVAEYAVALMFSLIKKVCAHDRLMRSGAWIRYKNDESYLPDAIDEKTIGFLGFGNIAQRIASYLSALSVKFLAFNRSGHQTKSHVKSLPKINFVDLSNIMSNSDIIFVTLPLTEKTNGLIDLEKIKLMKKTAYLINTSRGPVIREKDLYMALKKNYIAGAAIDVWYDDVDTDGDIAYPSKKFAFHMLDNMILSPYCAALSKEKSTHLKDVVLNLKLFAKEGKLSNIVDKTEGY